MSALALVHRPPQPPAPAVNERRMLALSFVAALISDPPLFGDPDLDYDVRRCATWLGWALEGRPTRDVGALVRMARMQEA